MAHLIAEIILVASSNDDEGTFWIQMLILVVLGGVVGIVGLIKARAKRFKNQGQYRREGAGGPYSQPGRSNKVIKDRYVEFFLKTAQPKTVNKEPMFDFGAADKVGDGKPEKDKDVSSGMEILDLDFLVRIVENTKGRKKKDVEMRKLVFNELLRREQLSAVNSRALNSYTVNKSKLYSKKMQCGAMKALTERTKPQS